MQAAMVFVSMLFVCTSGQKISKGQCPRTQVVENFNFQAYLGKWFDILTIPNLFRADVCKETNFAPLSPQGQSPVIYKEIINGRVRGLRGLARQQNPVLGRLTILVRVPIAGDRDTNYDILGTDYDTWSLAYSCEEILGMRVEQAWIASRHRELSFEGRQEIDRLIAANGIDPEGFKETVQTNCPDLDTVPFTFLA